MPLRTDPETMRQAKPFESLPRGVFLAPWMGPEGELVLLAVKANGRLACDPVMLPHGADRGEASDRLWQLLHDVDPDHRANLRVV
jgi:hypothetical protein